MYLARDRNKNLYLSGGLGNVYKRQLPKLTGLASGFLFKGGSLSTVCTRDSIISNSLKLPTRKEKAIVIYGTSIAQGACASRPGMSWAAILGRKMDRPVINLGFNGSGRLEPPVIDLLSELDAKIYILDCMPNLTTDSWKFLGIKNGEQLKKRVLDAVRKLRIKQPNTPILLADHAGFTDALISDSRKEAHYTANRIQRDACKQLDNAARGEL